MLGIASVKTKIESSHNVIETGLIWKLNYRNWYNDIVNKCCDAWNRFSEDKNRVISQCYRDWTNLET